MKIYCLAILLAAVSASLIQEETGKFLDFKLKYKRTYSSQEEPIRFAIFRDNLRAIQEHNTKYDQGLVSYKKGVNQFTDLTKKEFRALLTLHTKPTIDQDTVPYRRTGADIPSFVDWRDTQVTSVKNQGDCGSCWAFSIVGSSEAAYYRKTGNLESLSVQQLVDCSSGINEGCRGGYLDDTSLYVRRYGLQSEASYPYKAVTGRCVYNGSEVLIKTTGYVSIKDDENALKEAVAGVGPISVAMDATNLNDYESGIFHDDQCSRGILNHGVLVVGYGTDNGSDYWLVKNSWGADWGEDGYFKMDMGSNACGIAHDVVYPLID